jgi:hypothetical protein
MDFFDMSMYHGCVVIWWYYLVFSPTSPGTERFDRLASSAASRDGSESQAVRRLLPSQIHISYGVN